MLIVLKENTHLRQSLQHSCRRRGMPTILDELPMNRAPSADFLAQVSKFERFLILNKGKLMLASFLVAFFITKLIMPPSGPMRQGPESKRMQISRQIDLMMFAYSSDHNGRYPQGKSSTEIFQLLLDQNYASDPTAFYFPMTGKTR